MTNNRSLRDRITLEVFNHNPIPAHKQDNKHMFYFDDYDDNLYTKMSKAVYTAYKDGNGGELDGNPPKMASIASSSAMTFNIIGNDPVDIHNDYSISSSVNASTVNIPKGKYKIEYEKKLFPINKGNSPSHLDAFLWCEENKTGIFCEMKNFEWLSPPSSALSKGYCDEKYYFKNKNSNSNNSNLLDAFHVFGPLIDIFKNNNVQPLSNSLKSKYAVYDAWQMIKHTLAIYNQTSFSVKDHLKKSKNVDSIAGSYENIILLNVVNDIPDSWICDKKTKNEYFTRKNKEQIEAKDFIETMTDPKNKLIDLFKNDCKAEFQMAYVSAKEFADIIGVTGARREFLRDRYFG